MVSGHGDRRLGGEDITEGYGDHRLSANAANNIGNIVHCRMGSYWWRISTNVIYGNEVLVYECSSVNTDQSDLMPCSQNLIP